MMEPHCRVVLILIRLFDAPTVKIILLFVVYLIDCESRIMFVHPRENIIRWRLQESFRSLGGRVMILVRSEPCAMRGETCDE